MTITLTQAMEPNKSPTAYTTLFFRESAFIWVAFSRGKKSIILSFTFQISDASSWVAAHQKSITISSCLSSSLVVKFHPRKSRNLLHLNGTFEVALALFYLLLTDNIKCNIFTNKLNFEFRNEIGQINVVIMVVKSR